MEDRLREYVQGLFEGAPKTQKAYEMQVEFTQGLMDKYYTLLSEGKSEEEAYILTMLGIGDVSELFECLQEGPQTVYTYPSAVSPVKKSAALTAVAIMMYILSVVPVIILGQFGSFGVLGVVLMFVMVAAATGLLIYNSMTKPKRNPAAEGTVVSDFRTWQSRNSNKNQLLKAIRSAYWPMVLAVYFLLSFMTGKWAITWIIFVIAPAVDQIIKAVFTLNDK